MEKLTSKTEYNKALRKLKGDKGLLVKKCKKQIAELKKKTQTTRVKALIIKLETYIKWARAKKKTTTAAQKKGLSKGNNLMKEAHKLQKASGQKTVKIYKMSMSDALKKIAKKRKPV